MKLRAILKLRNEKMLAAREALQWSQATLAKAAETNTEVVGCLERMQYEDIKEAAATRVADILGLELEDVWPAALRGKSIPHTVTSIGEIEPEHLLAAQARQGRLIAPAPDVAMEFADMRRDVERVLKSLSFREREILKLRYGIEDGIAFTTDEIAHIFRLSRSRISQLEARAMQKLQHPVRKRRLEAHAALPPKEARP